MSVCPHLARHAWYFFPARYRRSHCALKTLQLKRLLRDKRARNVHFIDNHSFPELISTKFRKSYCKLVHICGLLIPGTRSFPVPGSTLGTHFLQPCVTQYQRHWLCGFLTFYNEGRLVNWEILFPIKSLCDQIWAFYSRKWWGRSGSWSPGNGTWTGSGGVGLTHGLCSMVGNQGPRVRDPD